MINLLFFGKTTSDFTEHQQEDTKRSTTQRTNDAQSQVILFKMKYCHCTNSSNCFISILQYYFFSHPQLTALWGKNNTEVVVSVVLSQFRKKLLVHHSELLSLRPHNWLTGEVCRANSASA